MPCFFLGCHEKWVVKKMGCKNALLQSIFQHPIKNKAFGYQAFFAPHFYARHFFVAHFSCPSTQSFCTASTTRPPKTAQSTKKSTMHRIFSYNLPKNVTIYPKTHNASHIFTGGGGGGLAGTNSTLTLYVLALTGSA